MSSTAPPAVRRALFFSDVHLSAADPATATLLSHFLVRNAKKRPEAIYILGDLFEYWAGDDDLADPFNARIAGELRALHTAGIGLYFLHGNRDLLIGAHFAAAAGVVILPDPARVEIGGRALLISHGDALCTDDLAYQNFRRMVRAPEWQREFLARPLAERHALIGDMRSASESAKRAKPEDIMDVNRAAVKELMTESRLPILVHGHTHRPARHRVELEGVVAERWVLSDWDAEATPVRGGGLWCDESGITVLPPE